MFDFLAVPRSICCLAACLLAILWPAAAPAQTIDLSLNVFYATPTNPNSGGIWALVAKSSNFGIAGLSAHVQGVVSNPIVNEAPRATFNGSPAGFSNFFSPARGDGRNIIVSQIPNEAGQPQTLFYGVGTLTNGSPNYPGKNPAWNSVPGSPAFSSLTDVLDIPWATGDVFGNATWNTAARVASGTFPTNVTPSFFAGSEGNVFLTVGTATTAGNISDAGVATVTTLVRTNYVQLAADYNQNGIVDSGDYILWRKTLNQSVPSGTGADGNNNSIIDPGDYTFWRSRFGLGGAGSGEGTGMSSNTVPEPTSVVSLIIGATLLMFRRNR